MKHIWSYKANNNSNILGMQHDVITYLIFEVAPTKSGLNDGTWDILLSAPGSPPGIWSVGRATLGDKFSPPLLDTDTTGL